MGIRKGKTWGSRGRWVTVIPAKPVKVVVVEGVGKVIRKTTAVTSSEERSVAAILETGIGG